MEPTPLGATAVGCLIMVLIVVVDIAIIGGVAWLIYKGVTG